MRLLLTLAAALPLAACATTSLDSNGSPYAETDSKCDRVAAVNFVGQKATADIGAKIQKAATAQLLRWGPPNAAFTMDYRENRVNVMYDANMVITDITCG